MIDNPKAFPVNPDAQTSGMDLRDYFAAKFAAAQATTTSTDRSLISPSYVPSYGRDETIAQIIARTSYEMADAMLAERSKAK